MEDSPTKKELLEIIKKNITRFKPSFEPILGFHYKQVERYSLSEQKHFFESLYKLGIVSEKPTQCIFMCHSCKFHNFSIRFDCTLCRSPNISRGTLISHDLCGNIDFDFNYFMPDGNMICSKCNKVLQNIGLDYSKQEDYYKCLECKAVLPHVQKHYVCLQCAEASSEEELDLLQLPTFQIDTSKLINILNKGSPVLAVVEELANNGIKSAFSHPLVGMSKITHVFDLVVYNQNNVPILVLDILERTGSEIENTSISDSTYRDHNKEEMFILSFIAKCTDVSIKNKILLVIPVLKNKNLKILSDFNGVTLIESQTKASAFSHILNYISQLYSTKNVSR